jgi:phage terminase large subunit GpA-like protein
MTSRALKLMLSYPKKREMETVSEWMERKVILTEGQSVAPGHFSFDLTPYLREIADNLSPRSGVTEQAVIKGNQGGFSTVSFGYIGYCVDYGIGPGLFVSGDQRMAEDTMEKRVASIVEAAGLQDKIRPVVKQRHDKSTGQRRDIISYGGTFFRAVGPRSEAKLRSFPSRVNMLEELDVYPQNLAGRGNPVEKVVRRSDTYGQLRRNYYNSTPKIKQTSQIEPLYEAGDKRLYNVPCPVCGFKQPVVWAGFKWEKREDGSPAIDIDLKTGQVTHDPVYYECANPECRAHWKNSDKFRFLRDQKAGGMDLPDGRHVYAEWVPTKKPDRPGLRSYKWPSLLSPFRSWLDIVLQFWRVKDDALLFPDFVNDVWAETWEEKIASPQPHFLEARAEDWPRGYIPAGVLFTTLAADIQADRIEAMLVGWGKNKESWALNYWSFPGTTEDTGSPCWKDLERVIDIDYIRSDQVNLGHPIVSFIDAGYLQAQVNAFCAGFEYGPRQVDGVYPVIGKENQAEIYKAHRNDIETPLISVHDQRLKKELYSYLKRDAPVKGAAFPYGYVHFPKDQGRNWYEQLTAEEMFADTDKRGKKVYKIENRKQRRNEVLDCYKMNFGALHFMCLRWYEIANKVRRSNGKKELEIDWEAFWASWTQEKAA